MIKGSLPNDPRANGGRLSRRAFLKGALIQTTLVAGTSWVGSKFLWSSSPIVHGAVGGVTGKVFDLLTGQPVAGVFISVTGRAETAITNSSGEYEVTLPPGLYEVRASTSDYLIVARDNVKVTDGDPTRVDFALITANPTAEQQEEIYARLIQSPELGLAAGIMPALPEVSPTAVTVPDTIWVSRNGSVFQMQLDEYLRHVVPAEMPPSWHPQALRAQAVAARTYAVAWGATQSHPICTTTYCQAYIDATYSTTDDAVWSTHNVVATYNGSPITAFYFARCNGQSTKSSEDAIDYRTCLRLGWNWVAYCRARSCSGHAPASASYGPCGFYGHGVGMCQNGALGFANQGSTYDQILQQFYTGIQLIGQNTQPQLVSPANGYLVRTGTAITLSWTGTSANYAVILTDSSGNVRFTSNGAGTSATVPGTLSAGTYYWSVTGSTGSASSPTSATRRFVLATTIYQQSLSVSKGSD